MEVGVDDHAVAAIDRTVVSHQAYEVSERPYGVCLEVADLQEEVTKTFPFSVGAQEPPDWEHGWVAEADGRVVGFCGWLLDRWNMRAIVMHLYVDAPYRGRGIARRLIDHVAVEASGMKAINLWLETSHTNAPGVTAYMRMGFRWSGFDRTLYDGTPSAGDIALFLYRPLR